MGALTFEKPDWERFPCLRLALEACAAGGTLPAVLTAANETVVHAFLKGRLDFPGIAAVVGDTLARHDQISRPTITDIRASDRWARETAAALVARRSI